MAVAGSRAPYSSGPLASAHHVLSDKCERCHVRTAGVFNASVTDAACLSCHDAPAHQANQAFTPECASCHVEHRGAVRLAATADVACLRCHADLSTKSAAPAVVKTMGSFSNGHPAFALQRNAVRDPAAVRFNHAVHLKENLRGPDGNVTLSCATCHRPGAADARGGRDRNRQALMDPITFQRDCASCHPLFFDPAIDAQAPHDKIAVVDQFVDAALRRFIAENPQEIGRGGAARGRLPVNFPELPPPPVARTAAEWVGVREAAVEDYLRKKTCAECHVMTADAGGRLETAPTALPKAPWMPRARFDHRAHQMASCQSCHATASASTETSDVLVPGIETCRRCHNDTKQSADARCFVCHDYHDWTKPTAAPVGFDIHEIGR
jgi:hypothetical protein